MRIFIVTIMMLLATEVWAYRKGPIFDMDIPAQKVLLEKYFEYNLVHAPVLMSRTGYYESIYPFVSFDVFKSRESRHIPNLYFSLAFQNHHMGFENPELKNDQYGYCLGVTTVLRKMNLLAFYDPENKYRAEVRGIDYYKKLIDLVMENRPVIIPHFSNLQEFSGTPEIKEYMVKHVLNQWATKNATVYSAVLQMLLGTKREYSNYEANNLYTKLKNRIERHYPPRLFLSKKNYEGKLLGPQYIHVMQAFSVSEKNSDGSYQIGVWHINQTWDKAKYFIEVKPNGTAWLEARDLGELDIVPGDDAEIAEMATRLKPFCVQYPKLCH